MKKILLASFACLLNFICLSQEVIEDAWIVKNNGDTLKGKISYRDIERTPINIKFINANTLVLPVDSVLAFGTANMLYKRYLISYQANPANEQVEMLDKEDSIHTEQVWLKILVNEKIGLGVYKNLNRSYFFSILNNKPIELVYTKGLKTFNDKKYQNDNRYNKTMLYENTVYKNQLLQLMIQANNGRNISNKIDNSVYNEESLSSIFWELNNRKPVLVKKSQSKLVVIAGVGLNKLSANTSVTGAVLSGSKFNNNSTPLIGLSYHQRSKKTNGFSFNTAILFSTLNTSGIKETATISATYDVKNTFAELQLVPVYNFNQTKLFKCYVGAGLNMLMKIGGKNTMSEKTLTGINNITSGVPTHKGFMITPILTAGFFVNKIGGFIQYQSIGNITNYANANLKAGRLSLGIQVQIK
ncbi:MAG: hypothetical protein ACOVNR_08920 [Chitinophagaceae bacterium]